MGLSAQNRLIKLLTGTGIRMKKQELNCITGSSNESTTRSEPCNLQQSNEEITEEVQVSCQCLDITTPDNGYGRRPTNKNKKVGLNADQSQWIVVIREEGQADRLDYDLRRWEPVE
ncbi:hypothetical protein PPACK8108_LOCUS13334 [Phakopsora pachyrhizi]|uniref:Uncharacterized protein n=1 Tax=Phakopsora pachyrhizi TaxID=170000 RepID=A0AAV0B5D8_PHAPC|nr:hypothetical protein PPACK8108_LOCUS13334 [Phakopsora pachyrhizi]